MDGASCSYYALIWNTISLVTFCQQHVKVVACEWLEKKDMVLMIGPCESDFLQFTVCYHNKLWNKLWCKLYL